MSIAAGAYRKRWLRNRTNAQSDLPFEIFIVRALPGRRPGSRPRQKRSRSLVEGVDRCVLIAMVPKLPPQLANTVLSAVTTYQVFGQLLAGESAGSRLRQYGLMSIIVELHAQRIPITITSLAEITGLSRPSLEELLNPLVERGLLTESWVKNSLGRGKARQFAIAKVIAVDLGALLDSLSGQP